MARARANCANTDVSLSFFLLPFFLPFFLFSSSPAGMGLGEIKQASFTTKRPAEKETGTRSFVSRRYSLPGCLFDDGKTKNRLFSRSDED